MDVNDWDTYYRTAASPAGPSRRNAPDPLLERVATDFRREETDEKPRALDLACGAGANAVWLAENGWDVTAVDRSPAAIELLNTSASERGIDVTTVVADLETHEFDIERGAWDLILMCRYLQRDLFKPAALGLAPGGALIVIALLAEAGEHRFRVQPGELSAYFANLSGINILYQREGATREHRVAEIAVQRDQSS